MTDITEETKDNGQISESYSQSFEQTVYDLIVERNEREAPEFIRLLHDSYASLQMLVDAHEMRCNALERENSDLKQQVKVASSNDNKGSLYKTEVVRLRDKVQELQVQLNSELQKQIEESARQLESAKELSKLKDLAASNQSELNRLNEEREEMEKRLSTMQSELSAANEISSIAEKHYHAFKEEMSNLQNENLTLKAENMQLVNRLVTEKEKMMDQFNTMNDLNDNLNKEVALLRKLLEAEKDKSQRSSPSNLNDILNADPKSHDGGRLWSAGGGTVVPTSPLHIIIGAHSNEITSIRYDPSGNNIVATASSDSTVKLWDTSSGRVKSTLHGSSGQPMMGVDLCKDFIMGCSSDKTCRIWRRSQRLVHHLTGHASKVTCCRLFPDGRRALSGSADRSIRLWEIDRSTYKQSTTLRHGSTPYCIDLSSDVSTAISGHMDGGLRFWDLRSGDRIAEIKNLHENGITSVMCSPLDGTKLLTNGRDSILKVVDVRMADTVQSFSHENFRSTFNWSTGVWSPDGNYVAAGSGTSGDVFVWNTNNGNMEKCLSAHKAPVESIAWARGGANGQQVASVDKNGVLVLWA